ncbi:CHAT domain-containing protein [Microvenator marinus]|uniref:CHAT domain-containing protein n=1 Tax=Microvenator marinus TaxID=2600177 RepID=A0A5B8Y2N4_9DELT|nr:CHAT domain-containing protein [Microvenator marinus]QED29959.1 CHAT domain-containing protein [Microvenator marinus]
MPEINELLEKLDKGSDRFEWERIYGNWEGSCTRDEAYEVFASGRPYREWFGFRFDAGPPGTRLPNPADAFLAITGESGGSPLDAYSVVFYGPVFPASQLSSDWCPFFWRVTLAAAKSDGTWFARWLAARACLAQFAFGCIEGAFALADMFGQSEGGRRHLRLVSEFELVRDSPESLKSPWIRQAATELWRHAALPIMPELPGPVEFDDDRDSILQLLRERGAKALLELIEGFVSRTATVSAHLLRGEETLRATEDYIPNPTPSRLEEASKKIPSVELSGLLFRFLNSIAMKVVGPHTVVVFAALRDQLAGHWLEGYWRPIITMALCDFLGDNPAFTEQRGVWLTEICESAESSLLLGDCLYNLALLKHSNGVNGAAELLCRAADVAIEISYPDLLLATAETLARMGETSLELSLVQGWYSWLSEIDVLTAVELERANAAFSHLFYLCGLSGTADPVSETSDGKFEHKYFYVFKMPWSFSGESNQSLVRKISEVKEGTIEHAEILAELARRGLREVSEARAASESTRVAIRRQTAFEGILGWMRLAQIWGPEDHRNDPVRDFAFTAEIAREALAGVSGTELSIVFEVSLKILLARSLRYSQAGNRDENFTEAKESYLKISEMPTATNADRGNALFNVAELVMDWANAPLNERLQWSIDTAKRAIEITDDVPLANRYKSILLNWLAISADKGNEEALEEAQALMSKMDFDVLPKSHWGTVFLHFGNVQASVARRKGPKDEAEVWQKVIREHGEHFSPSQFSSAHHNLGAALRRAGQFGDARVSLEKASVVRSTGTDPRHYYETELELALLETERLPNGVLLERPALERALDHYRSARNAAQRLGPSEELVQVALFQGRFLGQLDNNPWVGEMSDEVWEIVDESLPFIILNTDLREQVAWMILGLGIRVVIAHAARTRHLKRHGFRLGGREAQQVLKWWIRSQHAYLRPIEARLLPSQLAGLPLAAEWGEAVDSENSLRLAELLPALRAVDPSFLDDDVQNERIWRWLEMQPGAVAIHLTLATPESIALVLSIEDDERTIEVFGLDTTRENLERTSQPTAVQIQRICQRILAELPETPSAVLWQPGPTMRYIPTREVWGKLPVAVASSLVNTLPKNEEQARQGVLIVLADPGQGREHAELDEFGLDAIRAIEPLANKFGPVRILASRGATFGRALHDIDRVLPEPASAENVLKHARTSEFVIFIAHGDVPNPDDAALVCIGEDGECEPLDVKRLQQSRRAFAGSKLILLSCETGRTTDSLAREGGIAGVLIAAGAEFVVAPLAPVYIGVATRVCVDVLSGLLKGIPPWRVLPNGDPIEAGGPTLGPVRSSKAKAAEEAQHYSSYVVWVA